MNESPLYESLMKGLTMHIEASDRNKISRNFTISFSGDCSLSADEIWPDGDAPEEPTSQEVVDQIKSLCGSSVTSFISDWNLDDDVEVLVSPSR